MCYHRGYEHLLKLYATHAYIMSSSRRPTQTHADAAGQGGKEVRRQPDSEAICSV